MQLIAVGSSLAALRALATFALVVMSLASCARLAPMSETQYCSTDGDCDEGETCERSVSSPQDKECKKKQSLCGSSCRTDRGCGESEGLRCNVTQQGQDGDPTAGTCVCPADSDKCRC